MTPKRQFIIFLTFVVGFVLLLAVVFGRGPGARNTGKNSTTKKVFSLNDYAQRDSEVTAVFDGPINGDDAHRSVRITVSRGSRTIDVMQGYEGKVIKSQTFVNNPDAYYDFIHALARTGFGKTVKSSYENEIGICATGRRYTYEVLDNNDSVSRTWGASCVKGNSAAASDVVNNLFRMQITGYGDIVDGVQY